MAEAETAIILRRAGRYLLDHVTVARFGFDLIDALIMVTVSHANVAPISRDHQLQRRYATYDAPPPDEMRRPISINAVAQSLGMPFETVRRRVAKMSLVGIVRSTPQGVYVPTSFVAGKRHRAALESGYARLRAFYVESRELGGGGDFTANGSAWSGDEPLRLVARVSSDYLLRLVHLLMEETGDPVAAAVWLALFCDDVALADRGVGKHAAHKPISMSALARRLRLSTETTRRRVHALLAAGLCVEAGSSIVVDERVLARPGVQKLLVRSRQDMRRMFAALAEHGVVQAWNEAQAPRCVAA